jgi:PAS domain S-box-containing protein
MAEDVSGRLRELQHSLARQDNVPGDVVDALENCTEAVEELEAERTRCRLLFDAAPIAQLSTDQRGTIKDANRAARALFGLCHERLVGTPLPLLVVAPCRDAVHRALADAASPRPAEFVVVLGRRTKHGRQAALRGVAVPPPSGGGPATVQWTARNVTASERRQASLEHALANERAITEELRELLSRTAPVPPCGSGSPRPPR